MRAAFLAFALLALASCDQSPQQSNGQQNGGGIGVAQNLPDWLLVARQRDCQGSAEDCPLGEVLFNQRTITHNTDGTADLWAEVRYGHPHPYETNSQIIRYTVERVHYRFNCTSNQFTIVERQIMGANETVVAHDEPAPNWRDPTDGSAAPLFLPIACRGS
ncbi:MAG: surface-adhesin E family protein [Pseudomonadota bacterium]